LFSRHGFGECFAKLLVHHIYIICAVNSEAHG